MLYESIIDARQRHRLGEYYTPDWLAERIVAPVVTAPLEMRCADVSCGSGTFLFHLIRRHLAAADAAGLSSRDAIRSVVGHVCGIDVHPVAVTLARVTYLLAIGADRLAGEYDGFAVPVYLGDSIQWRHEQSLLSEGQVAVTSERRSCRSVASSPSSPSSPGTESGSSRVRTRGSRGIPLYEPGNPPHDALARLGARAERLAAGLELPPGKRFEALRRSVREALQADGILAEIDEAVAGLLDRV